MRNLDDQIAMFGMKPTAYFRSQPLGQLTIDVFELSEPPKQSIMEGKYDESRSD